MEIHYQTISHPLSIVSELALPNSTFWPAARLVGTSSGQIELLTAPEHDFDYHFKRNYVFAGKIVIVAARRRQCRARRVQSVGSARNTNTDETAADCTELCNKCANFIAHGALHGNGVYWWISWQVSTSFAEITLTNLGLVLYRNCYAKLLTL